MFRHYQDFWIILQEELLPVKCCFLLFHKFSCIIFHSHGIFHGIVVGGRQNTKKTVVFVYYSSEKK